MTNNDKKDPGLVEKTYNKAAKGLDKEEFSKIDNELQWTYLCLFNFTFKKKTT
jgi:hypothetical protein